MPRRVGTGHKEKEQHKAITRVQKGKQNAGNTSHTPKSRRKRSLLASPAPAVMPPNRNTDSVFLGPTRNTQAL